MFSILALLAFTAFLGPVLSANSTGYFFLRTQVRPNQPGKGRYNKLPMNTAYGGGQYYPAFAKPAFQEGIFWLAENSSVKSVDGREYFSIANTVAVSTPTYIDMTAIPDKDGIWQGVAVSPKKTQAGNNLFWFNQTGLQWTSDSKNATADFFGWLVCDWVYGVPQLFYYGTGAEFGHPAPIDTCAMVNLIPEYLSAGDSTTADLA